MKPAPLPFTEEVRLKDLLSYEILDTPQEDGFNSLVDLAALLSNCPLAAISFVDRERQWFKAQRNLNCDETSRDVSFCAHTILRKELMLIEDASKDERFFDSEAVTGPMKILFYAGAPIISSAGHILGSVCVMDHQPRHNFSEEQQNALRNIANQVSLLLELRAKNKLVKQQAEELVAAEKFTTRLTITEQETERQHIARELHENFAQTLAATKLYLEFAEDATEKTAHFIEKSKENISIIINEIRTLSYSIAPSTLDNSDAIDMMHDLIREWKQEHTIPAQFSYEGKAGAVDANTGLSIYRIMQKQLELAELLGTSSIQLKLVLRQNLCLYSYFTGHHLDGASAETRSLLSHIQARADSLHGVFDIRQDNDGNTLLQVCIPTETK